MWNECKQRVAAIAADTPGTQALDFMLPSPITTTDTNYRDALHDRIGVAGRLARDLAAAAHGTASPDDRLLVATGGRADPAR